MLGKYINQFMADNELSVNEEFFISSDLNRWRIVNVFHDGRDYVAVLERDK